MVKSSKVPITGNLKNFENQIIPAMNYLQLAAIGTLNNVRNR